ncbi:hypothetical protein Acel_0461 [Acidothermus cellulolyticus 11B]|uniref:Secreted protein n=1 Tax=Acidothermus cellulolyticus (strain ATCC 43068 / DSM 8971 / 11B) TaxID=351607 RepID=A0LS25_ACIC1|nr:DUF5719 family protein [Acidothermus cellulolyticus]ABK52235.1 hypothetical protein Acel_0461 [Acidothermus cellulolyticus 11B]
MSRMSQLRRHIAPVALIVAVAGSVAWATVNRAPAQRSATAAAVTVPRPSETLICPDAGGTFPPGVTRVAYANAGPDDGQLAVGPLDPVHPPVPAAVQPDRAWVIDGPAKTGPLVLDVRGSLVGTLAAMQFARRIIGSGAVQLATAPCEAPVTDAWFIGASTRAGAQLRLVLDNPDDVPATVDLDLYSDQDVPTSSRGIRVPGRAQTALAIDQLLPGANLVAVHVTVRSGRVVPGLFTQVMAGQIPLGTAWLPRADGPATTLTVPGFLGGDGGRTLFLTNPGDIDATVSLRVTSPDGSFTPTGYDQVTVPAGQITAVDLRPVLRGADAAVTITSDQPLVAGGSVALPQSAVSASDLAFLAAVPPLGTETVVPGGETQPGRRTLLIFSAPAGDATVRLTVLPGGGSAPSPGAGAASPGAGTASGAGTALGGGTTASNVVTVPVPAGTTKVVDLGSITKDIAPGVDVVATGGPVYAAWVLEESGHAGGGISAMPLRTPDRLLTRPPVVPDLTAGLP